MPTITTPTLALAASSHHVKPKEKKGKKRQCTRRQSREKNIFNHKFRVGVDDVNASSSSPLAKPQVSKGAISKPEQDMHRHSRTR